MIHQFTSKHIVVQFCVGLFAISLLTSCNKGGPGSSSIPLADPLTGSPSGPSAPSPAPSSGGPSNPIAGHAPSAATGGTSDGAGGNGVDGKTYESWAVDLNALPAVKNILAARLNNLDGSGKVDGKLELAGLDYKTWYIAPVDLDQLTNDSLDLPFIKTDTEQLARQSRREIWINKTSFDKMDEPAQAQLILHEITEMMYLLRFEKMSDVCLWSATYTLGEANRSGDAAQKSKAEDAFKTCQTYGPQLDKTSPPEPSRPLDKSDYDKIRGAASWIWEKTQSSVSNEELNAYLSTRGFDHRFFKVDGDSPSTDSLKVKHRWVMDALKTAVFEQQMPNQCTTANGVETQDCQITFTEQTIPGAAPDYPIRELKISLKAPGENEIDFLTQVGGPDSDETLNYFGISTPDNSIAYHSILLVSYDQQHKLGDRVNNLWLLFNQETSIGENSVHLVLKSMILTTGLLSSIDPARNPICQVQSLHPQSLFDNQLWIHLKEDKFNPMLNLSFFTELPIAEPYCSKDNVTVDN